MKFILFNLWKLHQFSANFVFRHLQLLAIRNTIFNVSVIFSSGIELEKNIKDGRGARGTNILCNYFHITIIVEFSSGIFFSVAAPHHHRTHRFLHNNNNNNCNKKFKRKVSWQFFMALSDFSWIRCSQHPVRFIATVI